MNYTDEQIAIIQAVAGSSSNVEAEAGAGCAKTTTLVAAAQGVKTPALALAFNKSIAKDMAAKLPSWFKVRTFHSQGYAVWAKFVGDGVKLSLDDRKVGKLVTEIIKDWDAKLGEDGWSQVRDVVARAQMWGLLPGGNQWWDCAAECWIDTDDREQIAELAQEVLARNNALSMRGILSFDDMVYAPVVLGGKFPVYPCVFVDENQDLNDLNHRALAEMIGPQTRVVSTGDRRQSIYGFRGAHGASADAIRGLAPLAQWDQLPLMTTFRCPRAVVARQQGHVPGYKAWVGAQEGRVVKLGQVEPDGEPWPAGWSWVDLMALGNSALGGSLAILCRNNAPLLSMAFRLVRRGIGVQMLGRDIGKGLVALLRKLCPDDLTPADLVRGLVADWLAAETAGTDSPAKLNSLADRAGCLTAVLDGGARDAGAARAAIERLFARDTGVVMGSIHKAKGLEWDLVLHLDPWRVPSPQARRAQERGHKGPMEQELNLRYVCETRTRHTLVLANLEDFE